MKLLGYVRVSRVGGRAGDSFISPAVQRERIEAWCAMHGHELADVLIDLDQSGGRVDRPEFQRALDRVEAGEAQGIVVAKLDRFARSIAGAAETIRRLDAAGAILASVAENIDSGPGGKLMRSILFAFAEFERDRISESWATARSYAIDRGVHISRVAPIGYAVGADGRLEPDPRTAPAVVAAFESRAAGTPWTAIGRELEAAGVMPSRGASSWTASTITYMIRNRVYLGEARNGELVNATAHPPLVSRALWESANGRRSLPNPRTTADGSLLSGLIRCAGCRYSMTYSTRRAASGNRVGRYMCKRVHAGGRCQACATITVAVDALVSDAFLEHHATLVLVPAINGSDIAALELEVAEAEAEVRAYVAAMRAADPGYREGYDLRVAELEAARAGLAAAAGAAPAPIAPADLLAYWQTASVAERRELLAADITAVMVHKGAGPIEDRVRIVWTGEAIDLPTRGCKAQPLVPFAA